MAVRLSRVKRGSCCLALNLRVDPVMPRFWPGDRDYDTPADLPPFPQGDELAEALARCRSIVAMIDTRGHEGLGLRRAA